MGREEDEIEEEGGIEEEREGVEEAIVLGALEEYARRDDGEAEFIEGKCTGGEREVDSLEEDEARELVHFEQDHL